tara:strand:+ start:808 stop:1113 length:306 start_codon:yes stop_codon:yes gene_type:complete
MPILGEVKVYDGKGNLKKIITTEEILESRKDMDYFLTLKRNPPHKIKRYVCRFCGKTGKTKSTKVVKFCSQACGNKSNRAKKKREIEKKKNEEKIATGLQT